MKTLTIDIETRPALVYTWDMYRANIPPDHIVEPTSIICFAAKWLDGRDIMFYHGRTKRDRNKMAGAAWGLLDEADAVIHYNGERFDIPEINRMFLKAGMDHPPSPYKQIDLIKTARAKFAFASNRLAWVTKDLGLDTKLEHEGFGLWVKCMANDADAWATMQEYNMRDVSITEQAYWALLPWIDAIPSEAAFASDDVCPACGSSPLTPQGYALTRTGKYQRYRCTTCGKWSRAAKRCGHTNITEIPA